MIEFQFRSLSLALACLVIFLTGQAHYLLASELEVEVEVPEIYAFMTKPIPQQATMCDLAGVGRVLESTMNSIKIELRQCWVGLPNTNRVTLRYNMGRYLNRPVTNSIGVFFATTNLWWATSETNFTPSRIFSWPFVTNPPSASGCSVTNWTLINDHTSFIPVSIDNDAVSSFSSNLVYAARVLKDDTRFYDLIREGATNSSERIWSDSRRYVFFRRDSLPTNLVNFIDCIIEQTWRSR